LIKAGAEHKRLHVRMVGGANMLLAPGFKQLLNIGERNVTIAQATLNRLNLRIAAQEVGGHTGRTVRLYVLDGRMTVRAIGSRERDI
jgi:chemotaxis protein CheD